jgi:hypothetical protein
MEITDNVNNAQKTPAKPRGKPFEKGNPGRPKGSPNKFTQLREAFLTAFENLGGIEGLTKWAQQSKNRTEFYRIISKMLPKEVEVSRPIEFYLKKNPEDMSDEELRDAVCAILAGMASEEKPSV